MNIHFIYADNETGRQIVQHLIHSGLYVQVNETLFAGRQYLEIYLQNGPNVQNRIINNRSAMHLAMNEAKAFAVLQANKIPCLNREEDSINRVYQILICDLDILSIRVETRGKAARVKYLKENDSMKAAQLARRVLILLGLDMLMVEIVLTGKRKWKIAGFDLSPQLREKDIERLVNKLEALCFQDEHEVKLGADPEFMLVNSRSGRMVAASEFFPKEGMVGCDAIRLPNRQQRPIAEIRPRPDRDPQNLISNIREALRSANRMAPYQNVKWVAGSQPFPGYSIGGHIHFSNVSLNSGLLRALDNYLGIPVFLIEDQVTAVKRRRRYGRLSDYRLKSHGGFEYRTPGSWLVSKDIATAVLCLAKIVVSRYYELNGNYLNNAEAQLAFYKGNQDYFRAIFPQLWDEIEALDLAQQYAAEISLIPWMIKNRIAWDEKTDLRKTWKIATRSKKKPGQFIEAEAYPEPVIAPDLNGAPFNPSLLESYRPRMRPPIHTTALRSRSRRSNNGSVPGANNIHPAHHGMETNNPDMVRVIGPEHIRRALTNLENVNASPNATAGY
jgi:hypothetical protein